MLHILIGNLGHLFIIISFIASLVATYAFFISTNKRNGEIKSWKIFARSAFLIHTFSIVAVIVCLFLIVYKQYYEYHYAWSHSSNSLPAQYMIACFWEGQEGSFLLWIFWQSLLGLILIKTLKKRNGVHGGTLQDQSWEAPVMTIFSLVQAFICSMILGVVIFNIKIGSSPFILLRDFMTEAPIFKINPDFIPEDGTGLNPLLQNYWMVIHPPTLFLGFSAVLVPAAFAYAGLWQKRYTEWVRPALPWALFATVILGIGILMGGYWAYETLNFGGYWNWDPVENAVFVPWIILVASMHSMVAARKKGTSMKLSFILVITAFLLILYSTFLTRSGILGDSSVHSFTDLGLSGQLLIVLVAFVLISIFFMVRSWKKIPSSPDEVSTYSREFWVFIGITVLCLCAFQIIITTSIPVYNAILESIGIESNVAPPADQIAHYSKIQVWFSVLIAILSGIGQYFWWKPALKSSADSRQLTVDDEKSEINSHQSTAGNRQSVIKNPKYEIWNSLSIPFILTLVISSVIILLAQIRNISYILLLTCAMFTIIANLNIFTKIVKKNYKLAGGSVAHVGIGLMLIGILFSSGFSKVVSLNTTGMVYSKEFPDEMNRENILLWPNEPKTMNEYRVTYKGRYIEALGFPGYIKKELLIQTQNAHKVVAREDILYKEKVFYKKGDTLTIYPENTYYEVEYQPIGQGENKTSNTFTLFPRAQVNPDMGLIASPDIKTFLTKDLYTHVSSIPDPNEEKEWGETKEYVMSIGDTIIANDFFAILDGIERIYTVHGIRLGPADAAVKAKIRILGKVKNHQSAPVYVIHDKMVGRIPDVNEELGLKFTLLDIDPERQKFTIGVNTSQRDYIILKVVEKPFINLLWIGTFLMIIGFCIAIVRRYSEFRLMRDKGQE
ncbi:MAG: cytochrome c biogenesis protein CcsA [Bacteroidetes bacterium]|nr:cytochrome c biogenesis protein CcsA [Bacteroidota bacterium]